MYVRFVMTIAEIYEIIEKIGCMTFSTIGESGEVFSRIAHFNGYDDDGLYFRTMTVKPYYRQLMKNGQMTVCGMTDNNILEHDDDGAANFPPSRTLRLVGQIKNVLMMSS